MAKKKGIHRYCQECLSKCKHKWFVDNGKVYWKHPAGGRVHICSLIKEEIDFSARAIKELDDGEIAFANFLFNPTLWTKAEFDWKARWYQDIMLKCLSEDQRVFMSNGTIKHVKDINIGDQVISYNETRRTTPINIVRNKWYSGDKEVYRIHLENGDVLECTDNHPIFSHYHLGKKNKLFNKKSLKTGYVSIKDGLSVGDKVYTLNEFNRFGNSNDGELAKILGYLASDSYINFIKYSNSYNKNIVEFCNTNKKYIDEFYFLINSRFSDCRAKISHVKSKTYRGSVKKEFWKVTINGNNNSLYKFLTSNNISNKFNREVSIFNYAFNFSKQDLLLFLNRAYAGDGNISSSCGNAQITYCSGDRDALCVLRILLKKIGIFSSHIYGNYNNNGVVLVMRRADDCNLFLKSVGNIFGKENQSNNIFEIYNRVYKNRINFKVGKFSTTTRTKIVKIEPLGIKKTYDIEVADRNNFIAEGIIVHNCTAVRKVSRCGRRIGKSEAISVKMLHYAYTNERVTVLVIAPYKNQVGLIFDKIDNFLGQSKSLAASIKQNTKNPYRIAMYNGSKILGFTSGTRTGAKSTGIRGQDAHMILIDEADYLSGSDFEVILAIQASRPDVQIWASSTPTGRRDMFWRFCFPAGTPISMDNGSVRYIEDIRVGDHVISADGRRDIVTKTFKRKEDRGLFTLNVVCYHNNLIATAEHPVWSIKRGTQEIGYNKISNIDSGDYVGITIIEPEKRFINNFTCYQDTLTNDRFDFDRGNYLVNSFNLGYIDRMDKRRGNAHKRIELEILNINKAIAIDNTEYLIKYFRFLGYFLAEGGYILSGNGHTHRAGVFFAFHEKEISFIDEVVDLCKFLFPGLTIKVKNRKKYESKGTNIYIYGNWLYGLMEFLCGNGSANKRLQEDLFMHPLAASVLETYFWGDGYLKPGGGKEYCTISETLAIQVQQLLLRSGKVASVTRKKCLGKKDVYIVYEYLNHLRHRAFIKKGCLFVRVKSKIFREEVIDVYNFETLLTHSYCASGFAVHNCTEPQLGFKEFHFPSSESPSWTEQTERLERAQYSVQGYNHEFEAEFGDEAEGVFLTKHVDASLVDYDMSKIRRNSNSIYTFGIDWNTAGNGTVIVVTEWNSSLNGGLGAFRTVQKVVITQEDFTQVRACEKIIEMNATWNPDSIYVDQGYGQVQIEMLRKYGLEHPVSGLAHKLKGIYFGDRVEIRDPVTKQKVKKHIKPFIVNIAARRMEDGQVILPESEDMKNGLVGQIRDYCVMRTTALGQPIYSDENDHTIVAWMLSIYAATMEYSDIIKRPSSPRIGLTGRFGEKQDDGFKQNRKLVEKQKRDAHSIIPRWIATPAVSENTLGRNLDYLKRIELRQKNQEKTKKYFNKKLRSLGSKGRSQF